MLALNNLKYPKTFKEREMKNLNVLSSVVSFMAFWNFFFEHSEVNVSKKQLYIYVVQKLSVFTNIVLNSVFQLKNLK